MSGVEGKVLGLHSTVFSERDNENTRLNNKNQSKKAEKRPQLRKLGYEETEELVLMLAEPSDEDEAP